MPGDDEDEPFIRAWEDREMRDLTRELGPIFRQHGVGGVDRGYARAERQRVTVLLGNDRAYRAQETMRVEALLQVESGEYANARDSVSGPTPEQFAQAERAGGGFRRFTPRLPNGTVRTVTAYRRKDLPQVQRMVLNGTIDGNGFRDCLWYRNLFESTGLTGNIGSIDYGREVFVSPQARTMFADAQVEAQDMIRFVRRQIDAQRRGLLDQVVLEDVSLARAFRSLGFRTRANRCNEAMRQKRIFAEAVHELGQARESAERTR